MNQTVNPRTYLEIYGPHGSGKVIFNSIDSFGQHWASQWAKGKYIHRNQLMQLKEKNILFSYFNPNHYR